MQRIGDRWRRWAGAVMLGTVAACATTPPGPCGELEPGACVDRAQVELVTGHVPEALARLDQGCFEHALARACDAAARARIDGTAAAAGAAGTGAASPFGKAVSSWEQGCALGDGAQCWELGRLHVFGKGVPKDVALGRARYDTACLAGHAAACVDAGLLRERAREEPDVALARWERACELGDGRGCTKAGLALREGLVPARKDPLAGVELLEVGCRKGFAAGCGLAALAWASGDGIPVDPARRLTNLVAGARLRDPIALAAILDGRRDGTIERAASLETSLAALASSTDHGCAEGEAEACLVIGMIAEDGGAPAADVAFRYSRACDGQQGEACGRLAAMIRAGKVPADGRRVAQLEAVGCGARWAPACLAWGKTALAGDEIEGSDPKAARAALDTACRAKIAEACTLLGTLPTTPP